MQLKAQGRSRKNTWEIIINKILLNLKGSDKLVTDGISKAKVNAQK